MLIAQRGKERARRVGLAADRATSHRERGRATWRRHRRWEKRRRISSCRAPTAHSSSPSTGASAWCCCSTRATTRWSVPNSSAPTVTGGWTFNSRRLDATVVRDLIAGPSTLTRGLHREARSSRCRCSRTSDKSVAKAYGAFSSRLGTKRAAIVIDEQGIVRHRHDHCWGWTTSRWTSSKRRWTRCRAGRLTQVYRCHHGRPVSLRSWRSWRRLSWRSWPRVALVGDLAIAALAVGLPRAVGPRAWRPRRGAGPRTTWARCCGWLSADEGLPAARRDGLGGVRACCMREASIRWQRAPRLRSARACSPSACRGGSTDIGTSTSSWRTPSLPGRAHA